MHKEIKDHTKFSKYINRFSFSNFLALIIITAIISFYVGTLLSKDSDSNTILNNESNLLEKIIKIVETTPNAQILRESLIVRLSNQANITMYGRQINDTLTSKNQAGRRKYDIHPYGKTGSGTHAVVSYTDKNTNEIFILLGRKYKNYSEKSRGLVNQFSLIGGYMKPHFLEGGDVDFEKISDEDKDRSEEAILLNKSGYQAILVPSNINLNTQISNISYDFNLEEAAIRELKEESGIIWNKNLYGSPINISTRSDYGITNDKRLHTIVADYLFDFGIQEKHPEVNAGNDIGEVVWIKITDIKKDPLIQAQEYGSKISRYSINIDNQVIQIRDDHGAVIDTFLSKINRINN